MLLNLENIINPKNHYESMSIKLLLSSNNCGYCNQAKQLLKDKIDSGEIEVVDIDRDGDARELARIFGGVPTLIEEEDGEVHELFLIQYRDRKIRMLQ